MKKDLLKAKDRVEYLLSTYPKTQDCDKRLWLAYLVKFHELDQILGADAYKKFCNILLDKDTVTMESVRRVRQKFQEHGKYVGTKRKQKLEEELEVRNIIRKGML